MSTHTATHNTRDARHHVTAAQRRLRRAIDALQAAGKAAPQDAIALLSDLDAAAGALSQPAIVISIEPAPNGPWGKLADAAIEFQAGPLQGSKLIGFGIWTRRTGGGRNVTFPARTYQVNGERRSYALLRPNLADSSSQDGTQMQIRDLILDAYQRHDDQPISTAPSRWSYDADRRPLSQDTTSQDAPTAQPAESTSADTTQPTDDPALETSAQPIARTWTAKHESSISAADLQEAQTSAAPDPGVLMRAAQYTPQAPKAPRPRRF